MSVKLGRNAGKNNPRWKGGKIYDKCGYVFVWKPNHPMSNGIGYVREHRLIMEKKLGRYLTKTEIVHHRNEKIDDNRLKNLILFDTNGEHAKKHSLSRKRDKLGRFND